MKKALGLVLAASLVVAGCASAGSHEKGKMAEKPMVENAAIKQAEADLKAAKAVNGQWRVIDKATGGKAVSISKLLKAAHKKAEAGETEEANRIAAHVSKAAMIGIEQAKRYAATKPYYN